MSTGACDFCHLPMPALHEAEPAYCCYGCRFAAEVTRARGEAGRATWMLTRLGVAVFLSMSLMMLSMYQYRQRYGPGAPPGVADELGQLLGYVSMLFAAPVLYLLGLPIAENALADLRRRVVSTDALVALGVGAAFVYSYIATLQGRPDTYYESGCAILVFITLGRWLEANGKLRASETIRALEGLFPAEADVLRDGERRTVRYADIAPGDLLFVRPAERIAADGVIESGRGYVDEQLVTGESAPVAREPGAMVRAGTLNLDGFLQVRATAAAGASTLGRLIALLESARASKGRFERVADRASRAFVPLVAVLAATAFFIGWSRTGFADGLMSALAVTLIACPCALGIATPMAVWVALGRAAQQHIVITGGEALEALAGARAVAFDKTGTLTSGQASVHEFVVEAADTTSRSDILARAAAAAAASTHVLAGAVSRLAQHEGVRTAAPESATSLPGRGLVARVEGSHVLLGSPALMADRGCAADPVLAAAIDAAHRDGRPLTCVGWEGRIRGVFTFRESLRDAAAGCIDQLQRRGLAVVVLTGDHRARAAELSARLEVDVLGELLPQDKVEQVARLRREHGRVAMVGDGLNDAPALAAADVGVAMGCGADLTRESAVVCLLGNDLTTLPWLFDLSQRAVGAMRLNLAWAFGYNLVGVGLAMSGRLSPIFAAGAMVVSNLFVVLSSLRLARGVDLAGRSAAQRPGAAIGPRPETAS